VASSAGRVPPQSEVEGREGEVHGKAEDGVRPSQRLVKFYFSSLLMQKSLVL